MDIFKDSNDYNEKNILGALSFGVMVVVMLADLITGAFGKSLPLNDYVYNSFVIVTLGCFSISGVETSLKKFASRKNEE